MGALQVLLPQAAAGEISYQLQTQGPVGGHWSA
jgi:hypothetical protein